MMVTMTLTEFLLARIAEREAVAQALLSDLERQIEAEGFADDERGPFTPTRMLAAQLWAHYDGQTQWRNFARGQHIATLASPARVLAECEAHRAIIALHDAWPVLAETPIEVTVDPTDISGMTMRASKQIAWMTEREYRDRFGAEPPTAPMIHALASVFADHPDHPDNREDES